MRRSLMFLAVAALVGVAACSGGTPTTPTTPTAVPSAAPAASAAAPSVAVPSAAPPSAAPPSAAPSAAGGGRQEVSIKNFAFSPPTVTVKIGDKVAWTNGDETAHTVTFDDASVAGSGNLNPGTTFESTFATAGSFSYHCKIHPGMKGTVNVS